jgi:hypothetical protein
MKKLFLIIVAACISLFAIQRCELNETDKVIASASTMTKVYNVTKDTVLVYVTLGATPGCIQNVMNIPWVTDSVAGQRGLQGTFKLAPGDSTIAYAPDSLGFNGVISFNGQPSNCPDTTLYPTGINQYEFMINNAFQGVNAQESINISCVHGVNCVIRVDVNTLNQFNAGPTIPIIQGFANTLDRNTLVAGVYPYGCDTCTGTKTPLPCIIYPQPAHINSVCQVQRNAIQSGGLIKVIYMGNSDIDNVKQGYTKATVIKYEVESCGYILQLENGNKLMPDNLNDSLKIDSLKVWIKFLLPKKQPMTTCMAGKTATIADIKKR